MGCGSWIVASRLAMRMIASGREYSLWHVLVVQLFTEGELGCMVGGKALAIADILRNEHKGNSSG